MRWNLLCFTKCNETVVWPKLVVHFAFVFELRNRASWVLNGNLLKVSFEKVAFSNSALTLSSSVFSFSGGSGLWFEGDRRPPGATWVRGSVKLAVSCPESGRFCCQLALNRDTVKRCGKLFSLTICFNGWVNRERSPGIKWNQAWMIWAWVLFRLSTTAMASVYMALNLSVTFLVLWPDISLVCRLFRLVQLSDLLLFMLICHIIHILVTHDEFGYIRGFRRTMAILLLSLLLLFLV